MLRDSRNAIRSSPLSTVEPSPNVGNRSPYPVPSSAATPGDSSDLGFKSLPEQNSNTRRGRAFFSKKKQSPRKFQPAFRSHTHVDTSPTITSQGTQVHLQQQQSTELSQKADFSPPPSQYNSKDSGKLKSLRFKQKAIETAVRLGSHFKPEEPEDLMFVWRTPAVDEFAIPNIDHIRTSMMLHKSKCGDGDIGMVCPYQEKDFYEFAISRGISDSIVNKWTNVGIRCWVAFQFELLKDEKEKEASTYNRRTSPSYGLRLSLTAKQAPRRRQSMNLFSSRSGTMERRKSHFRSKSATSSEVVFMKNDNNQSASQKPFPPMPLLYSSEEDEQLQRKNQFENTGKKEFRISPQHCSGAPINFKFHNERVDETQYINLKIETTISDNNNNSNSQSSTSKDHYKSLYLLSNSILSPPTPPTPLTPPTPSTPFIPSSRSTPIPPSTPITSTPIFSIPSTSSIPHTATTFTPIPSTSTLSPTHTLTPPILSSSSSSLSSLSSSAPLSLNCSPHKSKKHVFQRLSCCDFSHFPFSLCYNNNNDANKDDDDDSNFDYQTNYHLNQMNTFPIKEKASSSSKIAYSNDNGCVFQFIKKSLTSSIFESRVSTENRRTNTLTISPRINHHLYQNCPTISLTDPGNEYGDDAEKNVNTALGTAALSAPFSSSSCSNQQSESGPSKNGKSLLYKHFFHRSSTAPMQTFYSGDSDSYHELKDKGSSAKCFSIDNAQTPTAAYKSKLSRAIETYKTTSRIRGGQRRWDEWGLCWVARRYSIMVHSVAAALLLSVDLPVHLEQAKIRQRQQGKEATAQDILSTTEEGKMLKALATDDIEHIERVADLRDYEYRDDVLGGLACIAMAVDIAARSEGHKKRPLRHQKRTFGCRCIFKKRTSQNKSENPMLPPLEPSSDEMHQPQINELQEEENEQRENEYKDESLRDSSTETFSSPPIIENKRSLSPVKIRTHKSVRLKSGLQIQKRKQNDNGKNLLYDNKELNNEEVNNKPKSSYDVANDSMLFTSLDVNYSDNVRGSSGRTRSATTDLAGGVASAAVRNKSRYSNVLILQFRKFTLSSSHCLITAFDNMQETEEFLAIINLLRDFRKP